MSLRPPKHLKGRDIGLWYRQRAIEKREQQMNGSLSEMSENGDVHKRRKNEILPIICSVSISKKVIAEVNEMLSLINVENLKPFSYEFEKYFNNILNTSFEDYLVQEIKSHRKNELKEQSSEEERSENCNIANNDNENELNGKLLLDLEKNEETIKYKNTLSVRNKLPIFEKHDEILNAIQNNQIILVSGDTGCGKTTQIPQFILDSYIRNKKGTECNIFCTQPRRISAITVAERVAWERTESLGVSVGYQIRLQSVRPRINGSITYCTTGILLRRMENDPLLRGISHIILDEIHERDVDTDILLALLKKIHSVRTDLKIILMSATFCTEAFSKYFNDCPIIEVHGTLYPVDELYLEDVLEETKFNDFPNEQQSKRRRYGKFDVCKANDFRQFIEPYARSINNKYSKLTIFNITNYESENINIDLIKTLIFHITATKPDGAILVFLPGFDKISNLHREIIESKFYRTHKMLVFPLHSMMPTTDQKQIFERPSENYRKIILSTNIAETSITIDDVVYVIDSGKIKMTDYDKERNIQTLDEKWVSIANSQQRRGRAGRVQSGICYHLYTRARELTFERFPKPEILRTKLDSIILNIKMLRMNNVENFLQTMLDVPSITALKNSINLLRRINALDEYEKLTPLGLHLARLPMDPQMGKMSLMGSIFHCIDPITSVAASLSFKDPFYRPLGKEKEIDQIRKNFADETKSDHLMFANVIKQFRKLNNWNAQRNFCYENFLSSSTLNQLKKMKSQFCEILNDASFLHSANPEDPRDNINSTNEQILRAIICAGLYPNVAYLKKIRTVRNKVDAFHNMMTAEDGKVEFHPSSINSKQRCFDSRFFVYYMKQKSKSLYIFDSTMVLPLPLLLFADDIRSETDDNGKHYLSIASKFRFESNLETTELIMKLRKNLQLLLQKKALYPSPIDKDSSDDIILNALIYLLTKERKIKNSNNDYDYDDDDDERTN